jgi:hypothetical protein
MKLVSYRCDICGDVVRDERPFVSYERDIMANHAPPQNRFAIRQPHEVEQHICLLCLAGLVALAERVLPPG